MTKKDYIALAEALNGAFPISENVTHITVWRNTVLAVMEALKQDNAKFDGDRFVAKVTDSINQTGGQDA